MTTRPIAFDLTRLVTRLRHASPSGIDRVDLAYARHALEGAGARFGLVSTGLGPRVLDRAHASRIVEAVAAGWIEDVAAESDPVYRRLEARLSGRPAGVAAGRGAARSSTLRRRRIQAETVLGILRAAPAAALPEGSLYLHTSHLRLDKPERFDWLYTRADVRPVFFVHDLIPITHPEYGRPGDAERHRLRMRTIGRHAAAILVNSADTGERTLAHLAADGFGRPPLAVGHLGVEPAFGRTGPRFAPERPTFLVCGTIEPRKNHLLLLHLWRDLVERHGPDTPRLVLVGRRGWEAENVVDLLERCEAIRPHVVEVSGLSTHGLAALTRSCTALLMPSFTEGYGIPIVEAAASGVPVVASDIAVHREIGAGFAAFLDPLDGLGWRRAVEDLSRPGGRIAIAWRGVSTATSRRAGPRISSRPTRCWPRSDPQPTSRCASPASGRVLHRGRLTNKGKRQPARRCPRSRPLSQGIDRCVLSTSTAMRSSRASPTVRCW